MASWGGKRRGAGRKISPVRTARVADQLIEYSKRNGGETPLDFLWRVAMDEAQELPIRIDCAKAVCPYLYPRLQSVAVTNPDDNRVVIELRDLSRKPVASGDAIEQQATVVLPLSTGSAGLGIALNAAAELDSEC